MDQNPKKSTPDRTPETNYNGLKTKVICAIAGGTVVALYFTKFRTTITFHTLTLDDVKSVLDSGQGGFALGMNTRNKIMVTIPPRV